MASAAGAPLILYVPGLLPKPPAAEHRRQLLRCLLASMGRIDASVADAVEAGDRTFDVVSWTYDFYGRYRDIRDDLDDLDAALARTGPDETDIADAVHWKRRLLRASYRLGDMLPFLIPRLANESLEIHLRDLRRYTNNEDDIGGHVRRLLRQPLEAAAAAGRRVLLLAHSMGSVIAWDTLWQLSRRDHRAVSLDRLITLGSPLGNNYLRRRILGSDEQGERRYPDNIPLWINITAVGDLTALDRKLGRDFAPMVAAGLTGAVRDHEIFGFYRSNGELNVHNEYGYLMHERTAQEVCAWWNANG